MESRSFLIYLIIVVFSMMNVFSSEKFIYRDFIRNIKKNKYQIKIQGKKILESSYQYFEKKYLVERCDDWKINAEDIKNLFATSKKVTGEAYMGLYDWYPCVLEGYFSNKSSSIYFEINLAYTAIITNKDFGEATIVFTNAEESFGEFGY